MNTAKKAPLTAKKVILTSLVVRIIDLVISFAVTVITNSTVMLAESLQAMSDLIATSIVYYGVSRSKVYKDSIHQFGHGRELYVWTFVAAIMVVITSGIPSIIFGVQRILYPEEISNIWLGYGVQFIAIVTNTYAFITSQKRLVYNEHHRGIFAIFQHTPRVEAKTTFVLNFIGLLAAITGMVSLIVYDLTGLVALDGLGAIIIGLLLIVLSVMLFVGIKDFLIGKAAPVPVVAHIRQVINSNPHVNQILDLKTMYMGPDTIMLDTEIYLKHTLKTKEIEQLIELLTVEIQAKVPQARFIQIEVQTPEAGKIERKFEEPVEGY